MGKYSFLTKELLQEYYDETGSQTGIAEKYNIPRHRVKYYTRKLGVKMDRPCGKSKYTVNENIFSEDSEVSFYLAGFIAADGNITYDNRSDTVSLNIGLARTDRPHLLKIKEAMSFSGPILDISAYNKTYKNTCLSSRFSIYCSKKIIKDLEDNFNIIPQKSLILQFPNKLIDHPMVRHFIRGYFDGDGCFSTDKRDDSICFELLGTKNFLDNVEGILERECDLIAPIKVTPTKNIYRMRTSALQSATNIVNFLYGNSNIHLDRKFDIIKHML
jgi:intein/homing endonuclease